MIDFEGFEEYLIDEELSASTIDAYMRGLKKYAEMYDEISKANILEFKKFLIANYKPQTINLRITAVLRYCTFKDINIKCKHVKEMHKTHIENVISVEQYEKLCKGLSDDGLNDWLIYIKFLAKTGMRISEALQITKRDVLRGYATIPTKCHYRTIYFPESLVNEMQEYLEKLEDNQKIMLNSYGKPYTDRGVAERLQTFGKKYGIPKEVMHVHGFRHFFAIEFLKRRQDIALLADLLGHSSVNVTQLYLRQSQEQQQAAINSAVNW